MNHPLRKFVAAGAAFLVLIPGAAWADNVVNDVVAVGGEDIVNLQVGQSTDIRLQLNSTGQGNDGIQGCNLQGPNPSLTLGVASSASGVVTAPSSVQFTACNPDPGSAVLVHVTATGVGTTTLTFPYSGSVSTANESGSSFSTTQATFKVIVTAAPEPDGDNDTVPDSTDNCPTIPNPGQENTYGGPAGDACEDPPPPSDTTDPVVTVGVPAGANGAGWYNTAPISVPVSATDDVGVTSFTCTLDGNNVTVTNPGTVSVPEGTHTVACEAKDAADNTGSDSETFKVDATDPVVTVTPPATGLSAAGWYKTDPIPVAVSASDANLTSFTCSVDGTDVGAVIAAGDTVNVTGNGSHTVECAATDAADNAGSDSATVKIDTELPSISHSLNKTANGFGWFNEPVTADFTCDDLVSLIATCEGDHTFNEGENQSFTGTATDNADNQKTDLVDDIDVDVTDPELHISGLASATYDICTTPSIAKPTIAPTDNLSGIQPGTTNETWTTPSTATGVGGYAYSATVKDKADNEATDGRTYTLNYGAAAFNGPLQPINADGTSRFKLGSTVPVKFRLACNGVPISGAVAALTVKKQDGSPDVGTDEAISTSNATTGNLFRWSSTDQQYIFNLSTKAGYKNPGSSTAISFTAGTWTLTINLDDGTKRSFNLNLVR